MFSFLPASSGSSNASNLPVTTDPNYTISARGKGSVVVEGKNGVTSTCQDPDCNDDHGNSTDTTPVMQSGEEGPKCLCGSIFDLDEFFTPLGEASNGASHGGLEFGVVDSNALMTGSILTGFLAPVGLIGANIAYITAKGARETRSKLKPVINEVKESVRNLDKKIEETDLRDEYKSLRQERQSLEAYASTLNYSLGDTHFNEGVNGYNNLVGSSALSVMGVLPNPISLCSALVYGTAQTGRTTRQLIKRWDTEAPKISENETVRETEGRAIYHKKAKESRNLFGCSAVGFSTLGAGAALTIAATSGAAAIPIGVGIAGMLAGGGLTSVSNNKVKNFPHNGSLGVDRKGLTIEGALKELADRHSEKSIIKKFLNKHTDKNILSTTWGSVVTNMPGGMKKGQNITYGANVKRFNESQVGDKYVLDLMERLVNARKLVKHDNDSDKESLTKARAKLHKNDAFNDDEKEKYGLVTYTSNDNVIAKIVNAAVELGMDQTILKNMLHNHVFKIKSENGGPNMTKEQCVEKINETGIFDAYSSPGSQSSELPNTSTENDTEANKRFRLNTEALEKNPEMKDAYLKATLQTLFEHEQVLRYQQNALRDYIRELGKIVERDKALGFDKKAMEQRSTPEDIILRHFRAVGKADENGNDVVKRSTRKGFAKACKRFSHLFYDADNYDAKDPNIEGYNHEKGKQFLKEHLRNEKTTDKTDLNLVAISLGFPPSEPNQSLDSFSKTLVKKIERYCNKNKEEESNDTLNFLTKLKEDINAETQKKQNQVGNESAQLSQQVSSCTNSSLITNTERDENSDKVKRTGLKRLLFGKTKAQKNTEETSPSDRKSNKAKKKVRNIFKRFFKQTSTSSTEPQNSSEEIIAEETSNLEANIVINNPVPKVQATQIITETEEVTTLDDPNEKHFEGSPFSNELKELNKIRIETNNRIKSIYSSTDGLPYDEAVDAAKATDIIKREFSENADKICIPIFERLKRNKNATPMQLSR